MGAKIQQTVVRWITLANTAWRYRGVDNTIEDSPKWANKIIGVKGQVFLVYCFNVVLYLITIKLQFSMLDYLPLRAETISLVTIFKVQLHM